MLRIIGKIGTILMVLGSLALLGSVIYLCYLSIIEADNWLSRMIIISGGMIVIGLICWFLSIMNEL
jgi:hypothetical protein